MQVIIDTAVADDLPEVLSLYRHLQPADSEMDILAAEPCWHEILSDPKMHCIVARHEMRLVGTCTLIVVPNLTRGGRPYALIENVVTHADFRRQGIGTRMLLHALEIAWSRDCYKVGLMTGRKDEGTLGFYERAGFVRGSKTAFEARRT